MVSFKITSILHPIVSEEPSVNFRHYWKGCKDLSRATGISMTAYLKFSGFSEGIFLSSTYSTAAAWLTHPCTGHLETMSIKYTFSLYWKLVLLGNIAGCALLEKRHSYQEPSIPKGVPNNAPDVPKQNRDIRIIPAPVLVSRVSGADDPANMENSTPTVAVNPTQPPSATSPSCQYIDQCNAYASVRILLFLPSSSYFKSK